MDPAQTQAKARMTNARIPGAMKRNIEAVCSGVAALFILASCADTAATPKTATLTALPTSIAVSIPAACSASAEAGEWPAQAESNDWSARVASACLRSPSEEEIIRVLLAVWLAHFQGADIPGQYRLEKFAIVSIDEVEKTSQDPGSAQAGFTGRVTFMVYPGMSISGSTSSWWVAGSGAINEYGWVTKQYDVWVVRSGDFYEIKMAPVGAT
jgi:hypothetical protein